MKKFLLAVTLISFGIATIAEAQFRDDVTRAGDYTGAVIQTAPSQSSSTALGGFMDSINMEMGHSYSMNFSSYGGQYHTENAYTNHMQFRLSENMTGNVDVSFLHSPFGSSFMNAGGEMGARIMIDRVQLNYDFSPNTSLSIQFSQRPTHHYGMGAYPGAFGSRNNYRY